MRPSRRRSSMGSLELQLPTEWKAALISVVCGQDYDAFQHNVRITLSMDVLDFVGAGAFLGGSNGQK